MKECDYSVLKPGAYSAAAAVPGYVPPPPPGAPYGAAPSLDGVDADALAKAADYLCLDGLVDPILSPTVLSPAGLTDVTKLIETYYRWQHKEDVRAPVYAAMLRSFASLAAQASWLEAPEELVEALLGYVGKSGSPGDADASATPPLPPAPHTPLPAQPRRPR